MFCLLRPTLHSINQDPVLTRIGRKTDQYYSRRAVFPKQPQMKIDSLLLLQALDEHLFGPIRFLALVVSGSITSRHHGREVVPYVCNVLVVGRKKNVPKQQGTSQSREEKHRMTNVGHFVRCFLT